MLGFQNNRCRPKSTFILSSLLSFLTMIPPVYGHGHLTSPRSRNWVAWEDGSDSPQSGVRAREYCTHCLNTNTGVCGKSTNFNYDDNLDSTGQVMPWISQGFFTEGDIITVESYLDTHHGGHMEIRACSMGKYSTQECFDTPGNELHFVEDSWFGMPKDNNYPERGMYAGGQGGGIKTFSMKFKLPLGVYGDEVMLQWKYITANSCSPPGYTEYFAAHPDLDDSFWTPGLKACTPPYPNDGTRSTTWPEQFFNCAEISVSQGQFEPTISPKPTSPPVPVAAPTNAPIVPAPKCCSQNFRDCVTYCGTTEESCMTCHNTDVHWISEPQSTCKALHDSCTDDFWGCCDGLECVGDQYYAQCRIKEEAPNAPSPTAPPQPAPTNPTPTTPAPSNPTPPTSGEACCTIDFKNCSPTVQGWCSESEDHCVNSCFKFWLPNGPLTGCTARYEPCTNDSECCSPGSCVMGQCELSNGPTPTNPPVASPTRSPVDPTTSPTESPSSLPSVSPSIAPIASEGCYSFNYKDCAHPEYTDTGSCSQIWLPFGAQSNCIALWGECTGQMNSCCSPATCIGDNNYATCVPSENPPCVECSDDETAWMANNGKDCATSSLIETKCNKDATWIANNFCQLSCYNAGYGYNGDVCCNSFSRHLRGTA